MLGKSKSKAIKKFLKKKGATKTKITAKNNTFTAEQKMMNALFRTGKNLENVEVIVLNGPEIRSILNAPRGTRPKAGDIQKEIRRRKVTKTLNRRTPLVPNLTRRIAALSLKPKRKKPQRQ